MKQISKERNQKHPWVNVWLIVHGVHVLLKK